MTQYATMAQLQTHLGMSGTPTADMTANLNLALTNASAVIDDQTQRHFEAPVDTTRYHDAQTTVEGLRLWLNGDLAVLTSVTNGDGQPVTLANIKAEPIYGTPYFGLTLRNDSGLSWDGSADISVTGRWAYSVTPPDAIVQATLRLGAWFYRQPSNALDLDRAVIVGNTTIAPSAIPADVFVILRPYMRVVP